LANVLLTTEQEIVAGDVTLFMAVCRGQTAAAVEADVLKHVQILLDKHFYQRAVALLAELPDNADLKVFLI
jgi:hypothetical protein